MLSLWKKGYDKPRQNIKKQGYYSARKGLSSQSYGFSSSHVWICELDYKEEWVLKNWYFGTVVLEKTLESPLDCKEIKPVNPKGNESWIFIGRTDAKAEASILWPPDVKNQLIGKDPDAGKDRRQEEKGMTENVTVRWHHGFNGCDFEPIPGDSEGQRNLAHWSPWGHKELDSKRLSAKELMFLNCGVGENSQESLGQQGDQTSQPKRKWILNIHWEDWYWSSNTVATWYKEPARWKRPWCWERLKARGEMGNRGWDGWMASPTQWTWVWTSSRRWWRTGKPGGLQSWGSEEWNTT